MEKKTFYVLYAVRLKIDDLSSLVDLSLDFSRSESARAGGVFQSSFLKLEADSLAMHARMNRSAKSIYTEGIVTLGTDCDRRFLEIRRNITTCIKGLDPVKKEAAKLFKIFLTPYWDANKRALGTQISIFKEIFVKYNADEELKSTAVVIGIDGMMTALEAANAELAAAYDTRSRDIALKKGPSASSLKAAVVKSYEEFCVAVEQAVNFTPSESLDMLFNQLDNLRVTYSKLIRSEEEEEEEGGPAVPE
jgi:hypothetical protein